VNFDFFKRKQPLGARQSQRAALAARLADAEQAVAEAQRAATEAALEGRDDTALDKAEAHTRAAAHRVTTLTEAIAALDAEIEAQAAKELAEADAKQRAATARVIHKLAAEIEDSLPDIVTALRRGHAAIEAGRFVFGEIGLYKLLDELESSLPESFAILSSEMRGRAEQTIARLAPAMLPTPEPPPDAAEPIPRQMVFLLKDAKWRNPQRPLEFELGERFAFVNVPVELAAKALENGIAVLPDDERVAKLKYNKRGGPPIPEKCVDLNTGELPTPPSGPIPWNLQVLDRGGPVRMSLAPPATFEPAPAGARNHPTNNNNETNDDQR
jgi:multidrug efflux pump subunit AcrA (membrane-fusion protein)